MNSWEDLRKQARRYENEIDQKLVGLSKLGIGLASMKTGGDTEPLLSGEHTFETAVRELEQLLSTLSNINDKLGEMGMTESGNGTGAGMVHTLQRHREIFQDYTQEFKKTQQNFRARREREDLLHSVRSDIDAYKTTSGLNRRSELYAKEYDHLRLSDKLVDDQISIAVETRDNLVSQRLNLKRLQMRMHDISSRFPLINGVLQRINLRRRRDSIILGLIISFCTFLMIIYVL
ncbi:Golgi SNAP receptor complex member 1 [Nilaparvata lugens]|uniref:Golgi SNAP receptor complex member 1 n=1 Tax=Nilaparvata lugens TaxID=108931 RepID=UPI000B99802E|nr:Golgi SNAP receptor complex member 1 [Nilaparvata lugens]